MSLTALKHPQITLCPHVELQLDGLNSVQDVKGPILMILFALVCCMGKNCHVSQPEWHPIFHNIMSTSQNYPISPYWLFLTADRTEHAERLHDCYTENTDHKYSDMRLDKSQTFRLRGLHPSPHLHGLHGFYQVIEISLSLQTATTGCHCVTAAGIRAKLQDATSNVILPG